MDYAETFNLSYWRAVGTAVEETAFPDTAYHHFLTYPEVAEKFKGRDPAKPRDMLRLSITLASSYYFTRSPHHMLHQFAELHSRRQLDIQPRLYDYWLESVLHAVQVHDAECDEQVVQAWRHILSPAIEFMREKYSS